jgi:membrane associated rhomboid family serine protease
MTCIISLMGFNDPSTIMKLADSPYRVHRYREYYRILTHAFVHADYIHLAFNMLALYTFGNMVEQYFQLYMGEMGRFYFLCMYIISIIAGSLPSLMKHKDNPGYVSVGASGGTSGVLFASLIFSPWSGIYVYFIPMPAIVGAVLFLVYSTWAAKRGQDNINHNAHFYGAIAGFVTTIILKPELFSLFVAQLQNPQFGG